MHITYYKKINRYMNLMKLFYVCLLLLYTEEQSYAGSRSVSLEWLLQFFFSMYKSHYMSTKTVARGPTARVFTRYLPLWTMLSRFFSLSELRRKKISNSRMEQTAFWWVDVLHRDQVHKVRVQWQHIFLKKKKK